MNYEFGDFRIDLSRQELSRSGIAVEVEPKVLKLIELLIENRGRLVSKRELLDAIWDGRAVSDAALSTCIKSARRAVDDSGSEQSVIKTVHRKGFRWVAAVRTVAQVVSTPAGSDLDAEEQLWTESATRPSIAILPFDAVGGSGEASVLSEAIPHELIATIARLRWIKVIARGSSFQFCSETRDLEDIRRRLGVRYCLTGSVEVLGSNVLVSVVLSDTEDGGVIWADRFRASMDDIHEVRETIIAQVIFAVEMQIPLSEATKARLRCPENIDAWATYHLGLQSLYRFDEKENDRAVAMFRRAIELEPGFARAHAGLSFAHFKTAFMHYSSDRGAAVNAAQGAAERAIELDPMDPFANFNMGRSMWLTGDLEAAKSWLTRSTSLSPNFAQGIYARAWTETVSGSNGVGMRLSDEARILSPIDPLLYAMLGTRALALAAAGRDGEAAAYAEQAANAPGAHELIAMIAVFTNEIAGNRTAAARWAQRVRETRSDMTQEHFFRSFPFTNRATRGRFAAAFRQHDFPDT